MFVEEGFRIRFANGEVIDFYADTTAQKEEWMTVLSETVGKDIAGSKAWTEMVLEKERREKARAQAAPQLSQARALRENGQGQQQTERPSTHEGVASKSVPTSPVKGSRTRTQSDAPQAFAGRPAHMRTQSDAPPMPSSPPKGHSRTRSDVPPPIEKDQRHKAGVMPRKREVGEAAARRREQVRSMIF
jgi:hypothetical protein